MPVLPVVDAVADPQFSLDSLATHLLIQGYGQVEEKIVVATVDEPFDGPECSDSSLIRIPDEVYCRILVNRFADIVQLVLPTFRSFI